MSSPDASDETLFAAALERPPTERTAFLVEACGADAARRARVEALLRAHDDATTHFLATLATAPHSSEPGIGEMIGRYKLLQKIGEGGCGVVYMAEQDKPVRRRVALKVIKLGMDTKEVIARFEAERQALALMDHQNIARVFDAGATAAGRPFFVMELVRGIPITKYCDEQNLSTRARLELFALVCHAVQHAHQKGIIHRDIKPSNILVTLHDGVPVPKVIDFGIAKATHGRLTDNTLFTAFEQFIGTPAYMSPEQAEMSGLDTDTRSDIYSLGVLLYELLTGRTPFDARSLLAAGLDEIRRIIREVDPPRPSTRLSTLTAADRSTIAKQRGTEPAQLSTLLRGDLDWIVMRCLEKDRTRRYETANALALDVLRHLRDEPVTARPPSSGYRLRKLIRRHRVAVATAVTIACVLVAGIAISSWQAIRATRAEALAASRLDSEHAARREADRQRQIALDRLASTEEARREADRQRALADAESARALNAEKTARAEARKSAHVAAFLTEMLRGVGPAAALGRDTALLREITDRIARRLADLKDEPAVEADLRFTLGVVYYDLGDYVSAAQMQRIALALRQTLLGDEHPDIAAAMFQLGSALSAQSKYGEAETVHREALAMRRKLLSAAHPDIAASLNQLGDVVRRQGSHRFAEGQALMREGLVLRRALFGDEHLEVANSLSDLGLLLFRTGSQRESESMQRQALVIRRKLLGAEHPEVATTLDRLALAVNAQGRNEEAQEIYREALTMRRQLLGADHPDVAHSLHNLSNAVRDMGWVAEAETLAREALDIRRKRLGNDHYEVGFSLNALALHIRQQGRFAEAGPLQHEAVEIYRKVFPEGNAQLMGALRALAGDLRRQDKPAQAEPLLREALAIQRKLSDRDASATVAPIRDLAGLLRELGRAEEAAELERELPSTAAATSAVTASPTPPPAGNQPPGLDSVRILGIRRDPTSIAGLDRLIVRIGYTLGTHSQAVITLLFNQAAPNRYTQAKSQRVERGPGEIEFVAAIAAPEAGHPLRAMVHLRPSPDPEQGRGRALASDNVPVRLIATSATPPP